MRIRLFPVLLSLFLFCSGCRTGPRGADAAFDALQAGYLTAGGVTTEFAVTAFYDDTVLEYTLRYSGNGSEGTVEVLSPASVAGLILEVREEDGTLICDGTRLDTGRSGAAGITPAGIGPVLWQFWTEGYGTQCRFETRDGRETLAVQIEGEDGLILDAWFDKNTRLPVYCTVMQNGAEALSCSFTDAALWA